MRTLLAALVVLLSGVTAFAQANSEPNSQPNPFQTIEGWAKLPEGRTWGSTSAVEIDKDGNGIWVAERCGQNSCITDTTTGQMSPLDPILHFDASGRLLKSFGAGMLTSPHGIFLGRDGNLWVTDFTDNAPRPARGTGVSTPGAAAGGGAGAGTSAAAGAGAAAGQTAGEAAGRQGGQGGRGGRGGAPVGPLPGATKGHQVFKFSPDGKLLMTLGKPGGAVAPDCCFQPDDVQVAPNGDIFVSQGHPGTSEILKFSKDGKLLKRWGKPGSAQGEFSTPHALAMDSTGRLFVGDRSNNRIQIFDQEGKFLAEWQQFSRPSGIFIDKHDLIYVADSESNPTNHPGWKRGIRIGSAKDGSVTAFIPDPSGSTGTTSAAEGVAADAQGNVYGAEVGSRDLKKYVKK